jgi:hypothetical protein
MEMEGVERIANRRKDDRRVKCFVHDNDGKTKTKIKEVDWNIEETIDINHAAKAVTKRVNDCHIKNDKIVKDIKDKLIARLTFLLQSDMEPVRKGDLWLKSWMHFCNMHPNYPYASAGPRQKSKWSFKEDHLKRQLFQAFLQRCADYPLRVNSFQTTQANESFNHLKAKYLEKGNKWITSYKMRI